MSGLPDFARSTRWFPRPNIATMHLKLRRVPSRNHVVVCSPRFRICTIYWSCQCLGIFQNMHKNSLSAPKIGVNCWKQTCRWHLQRGREAKCWIRKELAPWEPNLRATQWDWLAARARVVRRKTQNATALHLPGWLTLSSLSSSPSSSNTMCCNYIR